MLKERLRRSHPPTSAGGPASGIAVRVLYSEGCPGGTASADVLRGVLSRVAPGTAVEPVELPAERLHELGMPGSPTILVNGRDLFPADENNSSATAAPHCRLYTTPEGLRSHPTAGMITDALRGLDVGGLS